MCVSKLGIFSQSMLLACVLASLGNAQDAQEAIDAKLRFSKQHFQELSSLLTALEKDHKFNGTVLVAKDGEILFDQRFGYSSIDDDKAIGPRSSFRLASVSKQFTAMAIMILQEAGKLNYDDDIRKFLPELPYEGITIRHLLHHTGGLPDYMALFDQHWEKGTPQKERKLAFNKDLVQLFSKVKPEPDFKPGEEWAYSNTGYVLLGHIIEKASGQPTHEFMQAKIFDPLGMQDSRAFTPTDEFELDDRVYGFTYTRGGEEHLPVDYHYLNGMIGDGGVYASSRDLLKWDQALYGEKLVKEATVNEAFTSGKLNDGSETGYGFGWQIGKLKTGGLVVRHGGGWVGFRTFIAREPDTKLTTIVLTNNSCRVLDQVLQNLEGRRDSASTGKE